MNSEVVFSEVDSSFYDVRTSNSKTGKNSKRANKLGILKVLLIVLAVFILVEAVIYAVVMPCLAPVKITYSGLETFTPMQVTSYLGITPNTTWFQFDSGKAASRLAGNAVIEKVIIEKRFPDQVFITVTERAPAALTLANLNGKTVPVQIDKNGVIFAVDRGMPSVNVPLVTGFTFDSVNEGMTLNSKLKPLMEQISRIQKNNPAYFSVLSEIRIVSKEYGNYELELYPIHSRVKVLTDRTLNEEALQYMMVVLDIIDSMQTDVSVVDLRYGSISYR